jgi:hypothetical protein
MKAITKVLAGGALIAGFAIAAPAAAQYYPGSPYSGYGSPYQSYGYGGVGGFGVNSQAIVSQCTAAVQMRLNGGGYGYGYAAPYGTYTGGRVLGVSGIEPRAGGGMTVRGVATSGRANVYGYGYNQQTPDLTWRCRTDFRGMVMDVNVRPARSAYGSNYGYAPNGYTPYGNGYDNDYSQYGYQRY